MIDNATYMTQEELNNFLSTSGLLHHHTASRLGYLSRKK